MRRAAAACQSGDARWAAGAGPGSCKPKRPPCWRQNAAKRSRQKSSPWLAKGSPSAAVMNGGPVDSPVRARLLHAGAGGRGSKTKTPSPAVLAPFFSPNPSGRRSHAMHRPQLTLPWSTLAPCGMVCAVGSPLGGWAGVAAMCWMGCAGAGRAKAQRGLEQRLSRSCAAGEEGWEGPRLRFCLLGCLPSAQQGLAGGGSACKGAQPTSPTPLPCPACLGPLIAAPSHGAGAEAQPAPGAYAGLAGGGGGALLRADPAQPAPDMHHLCPAAGPERESLGP